MPPAIETRTVHVPLKPKTEARLRALAAARGLSVEEYLTTALEHVADAAPNDPGSVEDRNGTRRPFDPAKWDAVLTALAEGAERLPVLPPEALTRAAIYGDHD